MNDEAETTPEQEYGVYIYALTVYRGLTKFGMENFPPPAMVESPGANGKITPITGKVWQTPQAYDLDTVDGKSISLAENVELWRLIVSSLTKHHPVSEYEKVVLVAESNIIHFILEARREFFRRATLTDAQGNDMKPLIEEMCRIYVPVVRNLPEGKSVFLRWAIV